MLSKRLTEFMNIKGLNKRSLAIAINASASTVGEIESGTITDPRSKFFVSLKATFPDLNLNWLLTGEGEMFLPEKMPEIPQDTSPLTRADLARLEEKLLEAIADMSKRPGIKAPPPSAYGGRKGNIIPIEPYIKTRHDKQRNNFRQVTLDRYLSPVATGAGGISDQMLVDAQTERVTVPLPEKADKGIRVEGHSMEPVILDHSTVYYRHAQWEDVRHGDLVIYFDIEEEALKLRRAVCTKSGLCLLTAINHDVNDVAEINDTTRLLGIVVYGDNKPGK